MGLFAKIANTIWNGLRPAREPVHTCTLIRIEETALHLSGNDPDGRTFHRSVEWNGFDQAICRLQESGDSIYLRTKDRTEYYLSSVALSRSFVDLYFELTSRRCDLFDYTEEEKARGWDGWVGVFRDVPHPKTQSNERPAELKKPPAER